MADSGNRLSYTDAGVDIAAGARAVALMKDAVKSTYGPEVLLGIGAFGGLFDISALKEMRAPVLVASTDGVGTKIKIASRLGRFDGIGQDIVNHCINDILVQGAQPLFFLDYIAAGRLDPEMVAAVVGGCAAACRTAGIALLGGETAEMPGVYGPGEFDLAGTIVGVVDRPAIIDGSSIVPGDAIIGLASSGLHTNGYSLARRVFEGRDLRAWVPELGRPLGDALLEPHRAYLGCVQRLWDAGILIKGMAHITGGGLIDNPPRIFPAGVAARLDRGAWTPPPIFQLIQRTGRVDDEEMAHVFNLGLGMLVMVAEGQAQPALEALQAGRGAQNEAPIEAWRVGEMVQRGEGPAVRIR
jgi:phosphoribosylformylglycinamidine cyclo-ligase